MDVRPHPDLNEKLNRLAANLGLQPAEIVNEAVERLVDYDAWFIRTVEHGIAQADAGELIPHKDVVARIESILQK